MTAQISDFARYQDREFAIAGVRGSERFDPEAYGIEPIGKCTACWRGFVSGYLIEADQLLLDELYLCLDTPAEALFGVEPVPIDDGIFDVKYEHLGHPESYTGGLLLARDFIDELYVHMGSHPAWKYREVHELIFEEGRLVSAVDRSAQLPELREEIKHTPFGPPTTLDEALQLDRWIESRVAQRFSLKY